MQSLEMIYGTTRRLAFTQNDINQMSVHFESIHRNGLDLRIQDEISAPLEMLREGFFLLQSRDLETDFAIANVDAGRGFFGGQKTSVLIYTSDIYLDQFAPGPALGSLLRALVGINNLYRAAGILKGVAF